MPKKSARPLSPGAAAQPQDSPETSSFPGRGVGEAPPLITLRALVLGTFTIAAMFYYIVQVVQTRGAATLFVHSQYPMAAFVPFVLWLFLNVVLKRAWPHFALSRGELLTIFSMTWVVGTMPQLGWMTYWTTSLAMPIYNARPENKYAETLFDHLPWHVFPDQSPLVIDTFWHGLAPGMSLPWDSWLGVMGQWLGASMAMVVFGFCVILLFQRQWVEAEKLTFPLAHLPLDLIRGFEGPHRMPDLFRSRLFWIGFGAVFLPMLYNIGTYFAPGLPAIEIYWKHYNLQISEYLPHGIGFRILPLVLTVTYMCPLDILGSLLVFYWLTVPKQWAMRRVGFAVGAEGQQITGEEIFYLESYGGAIFLALWSIWLARRHLQRVWHLVRTGHGDRREVVHFRWALASLVLSAAYVIYWGVSLGMSLPLALGAFVLLTLVIFVTVKLVAATGCSYLFSAHMGGDNFVVNLVGTTHVSPQSLVGIKIFACGPFFPSLRIPAWPAITHHLYIFSLRRQPLWVVAVVFAAFPVGFLAASSLTLDLAYGDGAAKVLTRGGVDQYAGIFDHMVHLLLNPTRADAGKAGIWLLGFFEAAGIAFLRARFHWFPFHPIGVAFQYSFATWLYWFSLSLVWITKFALLRFGGIKAYLGGKPFFYGLALGYVIGVVLSGIVDLIWFPVEGHRVHWW